MPAIINPNLNMVDAASFMERMSSQQCALYVAVGRPEPWGDNEEQHELFDKTPPTPSSSLAQTSDFLSTMIGIKRVKPQQVMLVIPRRSKESDGAGSPLWSTDWKNGLVYNDLNKDVANPYIVARHNVFYCLTSDYNVYKCIGTPDLVDGEIPPTQLSAMPTALFGPNNKRLNAATNLPDKFEETADGYKWQFQYDIPFDIVDNGMLTDYWIPVPFGIHNSTTPDALVGQVTPNQREYGNFDANYALGAHHVFVNVTIGNEMDSMDDPKFNAIPYDTQFRQIALILDPKDMLGNYIVGDKYAAIHNIEKVEDTEDDWTGVQIAGRDPVTFTSLRDVFDINSGQMLYLENCRVKTRQPNQSEQFLAVIAF